MSAAAPRYGDPRPPSTRLLTPGDASSEQMLAQAAELRHAVFVGEQAVDPAVEADDLDADPRTVHAVALDAAGRAIGTGRLLDPGGVLAPGRVGRMAVAARLRGQGVGLTVLRALEAASRDRGLPGVTLHAQAQAAGFYERAGYVAEGQPFLEQGIEHVEMARSWLPGIRAVTDADARAVQELIGGCFAEYEGCVLDLDDLDRWMLAPASRQLWVLPATAAGALDACVGVGDGPEPELKSLYVAAPARRRGWGHVLVRLAERAGAVQLWSDTRFTDAHRLYHRLGWRDTGERRDLHDPSHSTEARWVATAGAPGR